MIKDPTVLILGAGASMPFGFPNGLTLKNDIKTMVENQSNKALTELTTPNVRRRFMARLKHSSEESIDAFLEHEEDGENIEFGKMAIAATLLPYEQEDILFQNPLTSGEKGIRYNWYHYLWNQLNTSFEDFERNKLSIITFNYDRSLEYYLFTTMKSKFPSREIEEYKKKLAAIPVIHIYGKLGHLPWESEDERSVVPYNHDWTQSDLDLGPLYEKKALISKAGRQIRIVHEDGKIGEAETIKTVLCGAKRIYFLGFGYDMINLRRTLGDFQKRDVQIGGTMFGISLSVRTKAREIIRKIRPNTACKWEVMFYDTRIYEFLHNHIAL